MPAEGQIETGPNGERAVFQGGQWVMLGGPAAGPGPMVIGTPNKVKVAKDAAELEGTRLTNQAKAATAPYDARKAAADALKAEADAAAAAAEGRDKPIMDPAIAQAVKNLGIGELLQTVKEARAEIGTGRATGIPGALLRIIPGSSANDFKGSLNSIQGGVILEKLQQLKDASKTGASGMGALSEREGQRLADSIAALSTDLSDEKLLSGLATIERHAKSLQAVAAGENPDEPAVAKKYGIMVDKPTEDRKPVVAGALAPKGGGTGGGDPMGLVPGGAKTKMVPDPALAGVTGKITSMVKAGRTGDEIRSYLEQVQPGLGGKVQNLDWWVRYHAANPDKPIDISPPMVQQPLSQDTIAGNSIAQSPVGAGFMAAGDILSGGTLDNMTDNPALTRAGMSGVAAENPNATMAGQIGGAVIAGMGAEGLAGIMGAGPRAALVAGDILPSMGYGVGTADDGGRLAGGAMGGLAGAMGGVAGRVVGRGVAGATDAGVRRLADAGIRMTPGQLAGGFAKRFEDRVAGFPIVGDLIQSQRRRGIEDFNRASFTEALAPIGQTSVAQIGEAGVGQAQQAIGDAYTNALGGQRVSLDPQFATDMMAARNAAGAIPRVGPEVRDTIDTIVADYFKEVAPASTKAHGTLEEFAREGDDRFLQFVGREGKVANIHLRMAGDGRAEISVDPFSKDPNRFGTGALRDAMVQLRELYPEVKQVFGDRISGSGPGRMQELPLPPDVPTLTGENLQPLLQELRGFRSGYRTDPLGNRVAGSVSDAEGAITGMFERQAPDVMPAFNAANEAYSRFSPVQDAVLAAKNTGGTFMPSQLGTAAVAGAKRFGGRNAAARGDRALFELQRAGQDVLPSQIPDSGTAGRMLLMPGALGLGGAAFGAGSSPEQRVEGGAQGLGAGLGLSAAIASPYALRALIQQAVTHARPDWLRPVGEAIGRYRLPGALAAPMLVSPGG